MTQEPNNNSQSENQNTTLPTEPTQVTNTEAPQATAENETARSQQATAQQPQREGTHAAGEPTQAYTHQFSPYGDAANAQGYASSNPHFSAPHTQNYAGTGHASTFPQAEQFIQGNTAQNNGAQSAWAGQWSPWQNAPLPVPPQKNKRTWSTSVLALGSALSFVIGSLVGVSATSLFLHENPRPYAQQENRVPSLGDIPGLTGPSHQSSARGIEQGSVVEKAPGVVLINTSLTEGAGAGTGMVIKSDGTVLTNYHVVKNSEKVTVTLPSSQKQYEAKVIGHDASHDIAVLKIDGAKDMDTVETSTAAVKPQSEIYVIGNGSGQGYLTKLEGTVTGLNQTITASDAGTGIDSETLEGLIQTDADVVPGYSGGPMFNEDGKVIGVVTAASAGNTSQSVNGYAIPIKAAMNIAEKILDGESGNGVVIGRSAALGVVITNSQAGVRITGIVEESGAEKAGLQAGDVIMSVDGKAVKDASSLSQNIKERSVGDTVTLSIVRDGVPSDVQVTLTESSVN